MPIENYITSSCTISNHAVFKNGVPIFKNKETDLPGFLFSVYKHFGLKYARFYKMDNLSKLGWLTAEILLKDSFQKKNYKPEEAGVILSNTNASLDSDQRYNESVRDIPSPALFVYTLPNIMIGEICISNNFKGEDAFFISDTFDEVLIYNYVNNLLDNNILKVCICGWVELLDDKYKAVLFLVEKQQGQKSAVFTKENLKRIFEGNNVSYKK